MPAGLAMSSSNRPDSCHLRRGLWRQGFRTMQFLDWFVKEQGEEETNAENLIKKMELFGGDAKGLYLLDSELAARVYTAPSLVL